MKGSTADAQYGSDSICELGIGVASAYHAADDLGRCCSILKKHDSNHKGFPRKNVDLCSTVGWITGCSSESGIKSQPLNYLNNIQERLLLLFQNFSFGLNESIRGRRFYAGVFHAEAFGYIVVVLKHPN